MKSLDVISNVSRKVEITDKQLSDLRGFRTCSLAYSNVLSQYYLFCRSISDFKKLMYARAIDAEVDNDPLNGSTTDLYLDAENATMHVTASFLKFAELLPSLWQNCFPDSGIKNEIQDKRKFLYDSSTGNYRFLCELRNAIVHNRVNLTVSLGGDRRFVKDESILKFGYFINFDSFVRDSVEKTSKKKLLMERRTVLVNRFGRVDVLRVLSDAALEVYLNLVYPHREILKNALDSYWNNISKYLIENQILTPSEHVESYLIYEDETLFSSLTQNRTLTLLKELKPPVRATITAVAPSVLK